MSKITTRPWDSAKHLGTHDDAAQYFRACLLEGGDDVAFITYSLGVIARARGLTQVARAAGLTRTALEKTLSIDGDPGLATVLKIVKALGLQLHCTKASS